MAPADPYALTSEESQSASEGSQIGSQALSGSHGASQLSGSGGGGSQQLIEGGGDGVAGAAEGVGQVLSQPSSSAGHSQQQSAGGGASASTSTAAGGQREYRDLVTMTRDNGHQIEIEGVEVSTVPLLTLLPSCIARIAASG